MRPLVQWSAMVLSLALPTTALSSQTDYEHDVASIVEKIAQTDIDQSLRLAKKLLARYPNSRLGNLIYADLLRAHAFALNGIGSSSTPRAEVDNLRQELAARLSRVRTSASFFEQHLPDFLLQAAPATKRIVAADLSNSRLYLFRNENGTLRLAGDFYMTHGLNGAFKTAEGDQKTPVGVYHVTGRLPGTTLPSRYGPGALPINYPNVLDEREGRTGHGIWIHGTEPFILNRVPRASDGCLSLNNDDFIRLAGAIDRPQDTPVVISPSINWVDRGALAVRREALMSRLEQWRQAWESRDPAEFLSNYDAASFTDGDGGFTEWSRRKRDILRGKNRIEVDIDNIELYGYPGESDLVVAGFWQRYESDTFSSVIHKQQYWRKGQDGMWRIVYEGQSRKAPPRSTPTG